MVQPDIPFCEKCGRVMRHVASMPALHRGDKRNMVFQCEGCGAIRWTEG